MRDRKKHKTIDDFSVAQLLDDFVKVDVMTSGRTPKEIDDEAYIRMMLKKEALKKLERTKRETRTHEQSDVTSHQRGAIDDNIRRRFFPDIDERIIKREAPEGETEKPPEKAESSQDDGIVDEILNSIVLKDVSGLAVRMREAVDFLQDEFGTSDAERRLAEALEEYGETMESAKRRSDIQSYNDNDLLLKRCQNCFFCVGEKALGDSLWCLCTNSDRSPDIAVEDSWVKSELNLPCWKAPED